MKFRISTLILTLIAAASTGCAHNAPGVPINLSGTSHVRALSAEVGFSPVTLEDSRLNATTH